MILKFATARNAYGNRKGLEIDTEKRTFTRNYNSWHYDEYITISVSDRKNMVDKLITEGYEEE